MYSRSPLFFIGSIFAILVPLSLSLRLGVFVDGVALAGHRLSAPNDFVSMAQLRSGVGIPSDFRGTFLNQISGVVNAIAPNSCIGDVLMTGYKNDLYDEDDYGFQPSCFGRGAENNISCFPGDAKVVTSTRGVVPMLDLHGGEHILAWDDNVKVASFQRVSFFLHRDPEREPTDWVQVNHKNGSLILSSTHLLFKENKTDMFESVAAKRVKPGDRLSFFSDSSRRITTTVQSVEPVIQARKGIYAPVTESGTLFVDGVLASSYSSLDMFGKAEPVAHWLLNYAAWPLKVVANSHILKYFADSFGASVEDVGPKCVSSILRAVETSYLHSVETIRCVTEMLHKLNNTLPSYGMSSSM